MNNENRSSQWENQASFIMYGLPYYMLEQDQRNKIDSLMSDMLTYIAEASFWEGYDSGFSEGYREAETEYNG